MALARFNLSAAGFDAEQADAFCRRLRGQLEAQPGVTDVTYSDYIPLSLDAGSWEDLQIQGYVPAPSENMKIYRSLVAPECRLLKIPMLEGRDFNLLDDRSHPPVMIVSRELPTTSCHTRNRSGPRCRDGGIGSPSSVLLMTSR